MNLSQAQMPWAVYLPLIGTILAWLLGLIPLVITLRRNAQNALSAERRKLQQERRNIISALLAELKRLNAKVSFLEKGGKILEYPKVMFYIAPIETAGTIFDKYLSQLGSLNPQTIEAVSQAYEEVRAVPAYLVKVGGAVKDPENPSFLEINVGVSRKLLESSILYTTKAINSLEHELEVSIT